MNVLKQGQVIRFMFFQRALWLLFGMERRSGFKMMVVV